MGSGLPVVQGANSGALSKVWMGSLSTAAGYTAASFLTLAPKCEWEIAHSSTHHGV